MVQTAVEDGVVYIEGGVADYAPFDGLAPHDEDHYVDMPALPLALRVDIQLLAGYKHLYQWIARMHPAAAVDLHSTVPTEFRPAQRALRLLLRRGNVIKRKLDRRARALAGSATLITKRALLRNDPRCRKFTKQTCRKFA